MAALLSFFSVVVAPSLIQDHFLHILYHLSFLVIFLLLWKSTGCAPAYLIPVYWMIPSGYGMLILHFVSYYGVLLSYRWKLLRNLASKLFTWFGSGILGSFDGSVSTLIEICLSRNQVMSL